MHLLGNGHPEKGKKWKKKLQRADGTWTLPRLLSEKARHGLPMALSLLPCNKLDKLRANGKKFHHLCPSAIK